MKQTLVEQISPLARRTRSVEMTGKVEGRLRSVEMTEVGESLFRSVEELFEVAFDLFPVSGIEVSEPAEDEAVVQGEKLQSDDAGKGQPGFFEVGDWFVAGPRVVFFGRDHCKHGVAGSVEFPIADHQRRPPFVAGLF